MYVSMYSSMWRFDKSFSIWLLSDKTFPDIRVQLQSLEHLPESHLNTVCKNGLRSTCWSIIYTCRVVYEHKDVYMGIT